jgi:hypothetical protein
LSEESAVEELLHQAERLEKNYDWLRAAESYEKALKLLSEGDSSRKGETYERLGYAFYRAAFQAENNDEFRQRLGLAIADYEKAKKHYQKLNDFTEGGRTLRCDAINAYMGYWLATEAPEKKRLINECWKLAKKSLKTFEENKDSYEYGRTCNQLSSSVVFGFCLEWDFHARETLIREVVEHGEKAIKYLFNFGNHAELARAYARTAFFLGVFDYFFLDINEKGRDLKEAQEYWMRSKDISEETALFEFLHPIFGGQLFLWGEATDEALENLKKALEYGKKTRDKFIIGSALDWLLYHTAWAGNRIESYMEDAEARSVLYETILKYVEDAKRQYSIISFTSPRGDLLWVQTTQAECDNDRIHFATELKKKEKLDLSNEEKELAEEGLKTADISGYPQIVAHAHRVLASALSDMALTETKLEEKKRLLEEALEHRVKAEKLVEQLEPFLYWNRGMGEYGIASAKYRLASLTNDPDKKRNMLNETIEDMEKGLGLCIREIPVLLKKSEPVFYFPIGYSQEQVGDRLNLLYTFTRDREYLRRAARKFLEAAETFQKPDLNSRIAECYWKAAQAYGNLSEHLKAAENFDIASDNYKKAMEKTPQLKDFYEEYALYMQAWGEIENARYHHERQEYSLAKEHFEKAAKLHKGLKRWSYLEPNYSAWAQVEKGEELSRSEQCEEAIKVFEKASKLFSETKKALQAQLSKIEDIDEKQMATTMIKASDLRWEYCEGRVALEEARTLDKKGDHLGSSRKYDVAADAFEKICQTLESEQERKEFRSIISLSRAWQKMMLGDAKASPESYLEASILFEQASKESNTEPAGFLALGHSRFCKALEAGTRFADTRDVTLHAIATQHLESAATYYVKAGFQNASDYAKATGFLFDAYVHMNNAKKESDPEKKVKLYAMAEKVLQTSAGSFMKAEHPEKTEQVQRLLEKVKEERELALSLNEVLHAPSIVSTTAAFTTPTPNQENAVGLERFEHADVQASLIVRQKELKVGEALALMIELVNAGKAPALLIKVDEVIPEGFELGEKPETYRVEDSYIDMKGKRIGPLKTEELRLVLKPTLQGTFSLKPTVLYLDENGKYKSHEPEPVTITVRELGIKGWLKGER